MANHLNYTDAELATELRSQIDSIKDSHRRRRSAGTITAGESAGQLERLWAAVQRLEQLAQLSPLQQQFLALVLRIDPATPAAKAPVEPASALSGEQWERITKLLNHASFSKNFRAMGLMKLSKMSREEAAAYIVELEGQLPSAEQAETLEGLFTRSCFTLEAREQGQKKLAELGRAGAATYIVSLEKLADELEAELATASTPAQAAARPGSAAPTNTATTESTHPALVASPYDQARAAYIAVLRDPRIKTEERDKAMCVIEDWSEAELRQKTAAVQALLKQRQIPSTAAVAA